jgi:hypothetical protein
MEKKKNTKYLPKMLGTISVSEFGFFSKFGMFSWLFWWSFSDLEIPNFSLKHHVCAKFHILEYFRFLGYRFST